MKLKDAGPYITKFVIIDAWTHRAVETLPKEEALAKYGECVLDNAYTEGFDGNGFRTSVWIRIPGLHLGTWSDFPITLPSDDPDEATFVGKSGQIITVHRYSDDDYSVWFRDESERNDATAGCSTRGSMMDIVNEIREEV